MFRNPYPTHFSGIERVKVRPDLVETHLFRFKDSKNHAYIIRAEKYPHEVYAIKFHLKAHRLSAKKYSFFTKLNTSIRVLSTCLNVMVGLYRKNPLASFIVVGANSINEEESNTKRFRLYSQILGSLFPPNKFKHDPQAEKSIYLMVNTSGLIKDDDLSNKIIRMI
ncbi:hypothetical protein IC230_12800 [Spirosoma sp. BT704]|uniref:Uncharacterized protein n=1 Tax=Spirosoma validum TaxID=2771355 RepID=A0A927GDP1_9BACT|nr:hypothetical protein [Spirosoma validum]